MDKRKVKKQEFYKEIKETKTSGSRYVLRFFVWLLVIAFISSIGGMWNQGVGFPVIVRTAWSSVDLSPKSLYQMQFDKLDREFKEKSGAGDPRIYRKKIEQAALSNVENQVVRQQFYRDIGLMPTQIQMLQIQRQTGIGDPNTQKLQYGEYTFLAPVGVLSIISQLGLSDAYMFQDVMNFSMATEIVCLQKKEFLLSKISQEERDQYYLNNLEKWADSVYVTDVEVSKISQARKLIKLLSDQGIQNGLVQIRTDPEFQKSRIQERVTVSVSADSYDYFTDAIKAYSSMGRQDESSLVRKPMYQNGSYHVIIVQGVPMFNQINPILQEQMLEEMVFISQNKLTKTYAKEWDMVKSLFIERVRSKQAFSSIVLEIPGSKHFVTRPFTMVPKQLESVTGEKIDIPLFSDKVLLNTLLSTPKYEISEPVFEYNSKENIVSFRPVYKEYKKGLTEKNVMQNIPLQQQVGVLKQTITFESLSGPRMRKQYKLKSYPDVLKKNNF